ncbi:MULTISPECIES: type VI secretion system membrane subunit TssM [Acinetobacter]|uniref:Type VI secretion system membrane subunit TssM n=1 Tax=Acinetobacter piscicola TaxID=2006115 RepID=A0A7S6VY61_9GAMM|nr:MULTISPECIES: type VI secretion system membrane subunit TssM [Acinetobacter]QOW47023.1 type VI secretion system membrane subunit TssM [Acinetobacter piscicola]
MGFLTMFSWTSMWSLFGLISIVTTIWFAGPMIAFAEYKPLEPVLNRVLLIILVCLIFLGIYLFKLYKTKKMNEHVLEEIKASDIHDRAESPVKNESGLQEQFNNIDTILQRQQVKQEQNFFQRIFGSKEDYIYDKPWFIVIGAPGVGKTTAILNSGLTFPIGTTDHVSKLAGTRDCDWFLTDEALLLDTAGRFVEQNNDVTNSNDWNELLGLLKRCRPKQPINGLVLMLSADDILNNNDEKIQSQIQQIRVRLQEMQASFNTTFPLYIMVNKVDLISGFNQYFNYLDETERQQTFGVSLDPLSITSAEKINKLTDEIDVIVAKLQNNLFTSISFNNQQNDPADLAIGFPNEFERFTFTLKSYLKKLLNLSRYDSEINLSGVYFTSAVQSADDGFILDAENSAALKHKYSQNINSTLVPNSKSYFIHSIFKELLLNTANIAGIDTSWIKKRRKIYWTVAILLGLLLLALLLLLLRSFAYNHKYQEAVATQLTQLEAESKKVDINNVSSLLGFTNKVYNLPTWNINKELLSKSFFKNMGLSQHKDIEKAALSKHQSLIDESLFPVISNEVYKDLKNNIESKDYNKIYNNLKTYLMLYQVDHYDKKYIHQWVVNNIILKSDHDQNVIKSFEKLLDEKKLTPQQKFDPALVQQARDLLVYTDIASVIMQDLNMHIKTLDQQSLPAVSYVSMGGPSTNNVFRRVSDRTLNDAVNVLYTKYGYENLFVPFVNRRLNNIYKEEKWVIGDTAQFKSADDVISDIYRLYSLQYVAAWKSYLQDVRMVQPQNLQQAIVMSKQLSEKNSSLAGIIRGISQNTNLISPKAVVSSDTEKSENIADAQKAAQAKAVTTAQKAAPVFITEAKVQGYLENIANNFSQFQSLTLTTAESGSQLDEIIKSINDLYVYLVALELSIQSEDQLMPDTKPLINYKAQVNRLPDPFRPMLDVFVGKITESSQAYKDGQLSAVVKQQDQMVQNSCKNLLANKYPFNRAAKQEISIQELSQVFGKDGLFLSTLSSNVMVSANNQVPFRVLLDQGVINRSATYSAAEAVNTQYFGGNSQPKVDIALRIKAMDKDIDNLSIAYDGKKTNYYHGPVNDIVVSWPAKDGSFTLEATAANASPVKIETKGDWALYRMLDQAQKIIPLPDGKSVLAIYQLGNKTVQIEFSALSGQNPFNLTGLKDFKC